MLSLATLPLFPQGMQDSVFLIGGVEVVADRMFEKESAGMRETLIDTSILAQKAVLSLSDLLSENSTVFIKDHGRGALATASFRGSAPSHTRVNWNGIPLNSPMAGMVDFSLIPVFLVDQMSLLHGSASLSSGGGGIGGAIQIENVPGWDQKRSLKYLQGIGSYRTFDEFLEVGAGNRAFRSNTRLYHNYSRNNYPFVNRSVARLDPVTGNLIHPVQTNDHAGFYRYGVLQEFYFRPHADHMFSVKYWGQQAERTIPRPTSYEGSDYSNLNSQEDRDHRLVADWGFFGAHSQWMVRSGYSRKNLVYRQNNGVPGLGMVPVVDSRSVQQSLFNTLSFRYEPDPGFSVEGKIDMNLHGVSSWDAVTMFGYDRRRTEMALLVAASKNFADRIHMKVMLRQDWIDGRRAPFSPYLGVDLKPFSETALVVKGNVARNYHHPSLNDLYWQPGGNPGLQPEDGWTAEAGVEYRWNEGGSSGWPELRTELTVYHSDIRNWIVWIPSFKGYWEPRNIARVVASGLEYGVMVSGALGALRYKWTGSYACTRSVNYGNAGVWGDHSYGKQLVYIPLHSGNLLLHLSFRDYFITWQYNAYSERYTTTSNDLSRRNRLYPYFMNNLSAGRSFRLGSAGFSAELRIYNLLNESYQSVLYRPMPGRNYHLVIQFNL